MQVASGIRPSALQSIYRIPELKTCPIDATFQIIGKKWTSLILREMFRGVTKFNRLHDNIQRISSKMLAMRLKELRRYGIVKRIVVPGDPVEIDYELTEKGRKLGPILLAAAQFAMTSLPQVVFTDGEPRSISNSCN